MTDPPDGAPASVANGEAAPPPDQIGQSPAETARVFVASVAWGEHHRVWDLLAEEGRRTIFKVAVARGMDESLVERLREATATTTEHDEFLTDLVNGLRADLQGIDLDSLDFEIDPTVSESGQARVAITARLPASLAAMGTGLPAGSVELSYERDGWRVVRLRPTADR